jgi:acetyl-CoA carboxylase biotin carboxylase subunit
LRGHAIECRINAEDPGNNFMPSPGLINSFHMPGGMNIRVDTHVYSGYKVPPNYDSMIAKLIVHGLNREDAINKMLSALDEFVIEGINTIIPYHKQILNDKNFKAGNFDTSFIENFNYTRGNKNENN